MREIMWSKNVGSKVLATKMSREQCRDKNVATKMLAQKMSAQKMSAQKCREKNVATKMSREKCYMSTLGYEMYRLVTDLMHV